jgi:hypothetical protein
MASEIKKVESGIGEKKCTKNQGKTRQTKVLCNSPLMKRNERITIVKIAK